MKILDFNEISFENQAISSVSVIAQTNNWAVCAPRGRILNGFLLITEGSCTYEWDNEVAELSPGSLIYLPKGSYHSVTAPEKSLKFYRISFVIVDNESGEDVIFSKTPRVIAENVPKNLFDICEELRRTTLNHHTDFLTVSLVCALIDFAAKTVEKDTLCGIDRAIEFVKSHYTEEITVEALAEMAFVSPVHLFRLFKTKTGMPPIEYKNSLRIKKAESLLCDPYCSIGEIADILGFDNVCYFTRSFKKYTGMSPTEFRKTIISTQKNN